MSAVQPDWYDPHSFPQWREGPPWVMEDMVAAQTMLPERMEGQLAEDSKRVAAVLQAAAEAGEPIVTSAVGTSGHAAKAVALVLNDALGESPVAARPVEARESADESLAPRSGGVCLAVSHGGLSKSTVAALAAARAAGARTVVITAAAHSPVKDIADDVLTTPMVDRSWCHTVGYTSPILTSLLLASLIRGQAFPAAELAAYLRELTGLGPAASRIGANLGGVRRIISAGSLVDAPTAREFALKVAEGARVPASMLGVEDVLHGHLVAHDADTALVVFVTGGPQAQRAIQGARELLMSARRIGLQTSVVVTDQLNDGVTADDANAGILTIPTSGLPEITVSVLGGALALQQLTIGLVHAVRTNPDLLRREETPYREAVTVGGAKHPRR